jgi:hypothetical protein
MGSKFLPTSMPGPASTGSVRSRSISPYGSATAGTPSSRDSPSSEFNNGNNKEESSAGLNGHLLLHNANNNQEMTTSNGSINTNSSMNGSIPPDSDLESEGGKEPNNKSGIDATPRPNIKALTNKQRNWFSSFEKGRSVENVDSARRTSVKSDNTPSLLSGGAATESPSERSLLDVTPTPPANLNLPGDRRPLSAKASSDSIEDYLKNWKKTNSGGSTPTKPPQYDAFHSNDNENSISG